MNDRFHGEEGTWVGKRRTIAKEEYVLSNATLSISLTPALHLPARFYRGSKVGSQGNKEVAMPGAASSIYEDLSEPQDPNQE